MSAYRWTWPTPDPERTIYPDGTEAAHGARGAGSAIDVRSWPTGGVKIPLLPVLAATPGAWGRVDRVYEDAECGKAIEYWTLVDGLGYCRFRLCHLDSVNVYDGQIIKAETVLGVMGETGAAQGVHVHLVMWVGTERVRPSDYLLEVIPVEPTLVERLEAIEQELQRLHQFGLGTFGNLTLEDGGREPSNPVKLLLGKLGENLGLYGFFQRRFPGQSVGEFWAGLETSVPADLPANGYGGLPMRLWSQNVLLEANGALVVRTAVAERVYLSPPVYRDLRTGAFVSPASWSDAGEPLDAEGRLMGGIYYDAANLGTYLTVVDGRPVVVHQGEVRELIAPGG